jgi:dihydroflavonol-4-reductase
MKTLVTGANGFLGSAIMRHLLEAGHEVRVWVRAQSDRRNLNNLPVEICEGDLRDITSIKRADETTLSSLPLMTGHYKRSKFLAEQAVQRLTDQHKLSLVIVNPSTPIGPCDIKPTPTGGIVLDTLLDRMPAYVDTGLNIVHVDDVARGHLLAFELGKAGERYVLGGENMSLLQILEMIDEITGKKSKRIRLPHNLVLPATWLMEKAATLTKVEPRATTDSVRMAKKQIFFSGAKALREQNYRHRPARDAIKDAILWFCENGYYK